MKLPYLILLQFLEQNCQNDSQLGLGYKGNPEGNFALILIIHMCQEGNNLIINT